MNQDRLLRLIASIILLSQLLFITSCSDSIPKLSRLNSNAVVLAFGDSLTYGTGARSEESYPAQLEKLTGLEVINEGVPGELSAAGLQRLPEVLDEVEPDLLILCHGGNDMLRKRSKEKLTNNLSSMIGEAHRRGIQVILIGVPEPALFLLEAAPFYKNLAIEKSIPVENNALPEILSDNDLKSDTIHPNATGYRKLAEAIGTLLKKSGAI